MMLHKTVVLVISILLLSSCRKPANRIANSEEHSVAENASEIISDDVITKDSSNIREPGEKSSSDKISDEGISMSVGSPEYDWLPKLTVSRPQQILYRAGYITSYNNKTKNANWVAWHLTKEHTDGRWSRDGIPYMVDEDVKGKRQELEDWDNLRLPVDHGHLCPAGDNKWSQQAMEQTFLLTNMSPQNSELNRGDWEKLESRCRGWANHYGDIYIVAGPIFYSNNYKTIGANKVGVPDAFFKVILCLNKNPKALGFIYPNVGDHHDMKYYVKTVDEVENITGIDFFYNLPDDKESQVESVSNYNKW